MSRKLLLDTNILLDAAMAERPAHIAATLLMDELLYEDVDGYVVSLSLKDAYYILAKYADERSAREFVLSALDLFSVVNVDASICRVAALSDEPDFEDGIVRACAERLGADFIISHDKTAFKRSRLKRLSAREYLDLFAEIEEVPLPEAPESQDAS